MSGSGQFNVLLVNSSFMECTPCKGTPESNFTVSALPDCVRLEGLCVVSATFMTECFVVMPSSRRLGKIRRTADGAVHKKTPLFFCFGTVQNFTL